MTSGRRTIKTTPKLYAMAACGDFVSLATAGLSDDAPYTLMLCNCIGSPLELRPLAIEPKALAMTERCVVVASKSEVEVWTFKTPSAMVGMGGLRALESRQGRVRRIPMPVESDDGIVALHARQERLVRQEGC